MLKIIQGGFNSGVREWLQNEILKRTEDKARSYLIVPEQQTVIEEGEMCGLLPDFAPLYFEATNFTRFSNTVLRSLGGLAGEHCTKERRLLLMWKTLSELSPTLLTLGRSDEIAPGFISRTASAVAEMQSLGISAEELYSAAENPEISKNARLRSKISDLADIMSLYKKTVLEGYQSTDDDLAAASDRLLANPSILEKTTIYIEGFTSFTEPQYRLIGTLMRYTELTVILNIPKAEERSYEFAELRATASRLIRIADKLGCEKKLVKLDGEFSPRSSFLAEAERLLFKTEGTVSQDALAHSCDVRIFEAENPFDECNFIAADIKRRVCAGARYSDFAVIARRADKYAGILDLAFRDYAIPCFASFKKSVSSYEAVKLIYTAYEIALRGFLREDVITYAKCGLSGIDDALIDELELYCEKWQISGRGFSDGTSWNMNPRGYETGVDTEKLERLNSLRRLLIEPLIAFCESIKEARCVREHTEALTDFLVGLNIEEKLIERAERLSAMGENAAAEENLKIWGIICGVLDTLVSTLDATEVSTESFRTLLKILFSEASISRIPSYLDEVTVGSADIVRIKNKKHIYLIGVNQGEFPSAISEGDYFTDKDRDIMRGVGLAFDACAEVQSARELYAFRRAFAFAGESVTVSYSAANARQKPETPSDVVSRLLEMTGGKICIKRTSEIPPSELIYTPQSALFRLGEGSRTENAAICEALSARGFDEYVRVSRGSAINDLLSLSAETCAEIYKRDLALTQSRIDSYVNCPLAYFCKFELKLSDNRRAEWSAANIGSFIHAILENFFRTLRERGTSITNLSDDEKRSLTKKSARKYLDELFSSGGVSGARMNILISRLERAALPIIDGLCLEFSGCKFVPSFFELEIKRDNPESPSPVVFGKEDGGRVYVYGTIDRVDTYSKDGDVYVRVIDYKTGAKEFSPKDLEEGRNLQMFLYLKSIIDTQNGEFKRALGASKDGRLIPAGVIYTNTTVSDATVKNQNEERAEIQKKQKRSGMILDDAESIAAMNRDYLPTAFDADGNPKNKDRLYTLEGWERLSETIEKSVVTVADSIKNGDISTAHAAKDRECGYCEYKAVCRNAKL